MIITVLGAIEAICRAASGPFITRQVQNDDGFEVLSLSTAIEPFLLPPNHFAARPGSRKRRIAGLSSTIMDIATRRAIALSRLTEPNRGVGLTEGNNASLFRNTRQSIQRTLYANVPSFVWYRTDSYDSVG
jgi:hypothetical protein